MFTEEFVSEGEAGSQLAARYHSWLNSQPGWRVDDDIKYHMDDNSDVVYEIRAYYNASSEHVFVIRGETIEVKYA